MCGIAGRLTWEGRTDGAAVKRMCDKLIHRGPDDFGIEELSCMQLGHRRLSIIDLSDKARQPMCSSDGTHYIVYNGEVYNFQELRKELEGFGFNFRTKSDTEVVLYSYIKWGPACLTRFNGMFALAIWNTRKRELFLARDRFGKKPLYYYIDPHLGVVFASELTALMEEGSIPQRVSPEALNCYLALGYILSPMTLYEDVFKLEPATYMVFSDSGRSVRKIKYWDYAETFSNKTCETDETIGEKLLMFLREAVRKRLVADVPVGAFLSGGIDSSSIVSIMKECHGDELHTFSIGFDQESYNELPDAERAAAWIKTRHHSKICRGDEHGLLDSAIDAYDEPFADNSLIPMVEVSRLASQYVKVVLSGDGADEVFAGYITYKADKLYRIARFLPVFLKEFAGKTTGKNCGMRVKKLDWRYKRKQFFHGSLYPPQKAHYLWRIIFRPEERINIIGEQFRDLVYDTDPFYSFEKYYDKVKHLHWLDQNLYVDGMTWLPDDILVKVDRASMLNGIEARSPYLDVDLVSYAASVPVNLKMKGLRTKYILKKMLKRVLPDFILNKRKAGFNAPVNAWLGCYGADEFKTFNRYVFDRKVAHCLR